MTYIIRFLAEFLKKVSLARWILLGIPTFEATFPKKDSHDYVSQFGGQTLNLSWKNNALTITPFRHGPYIYVVKEGGRGIDWRQRKVLYILFGPPWTDPDARLFLSAVYAHQKQNKDMTTYRKTDIDVSFQSDPLFTFNRAYAAVEI